MLIFVLAIAKSLADTKIFPKTVKKMAKALASFSVNLFFIYKVLRGHFPLKMSVNIDYVKYPMYDNGQEV